MPNRQVVIRAARVEEVASFIEIEQAAGETFRSIGMDLVADDDPGTVDELTPYAEAGRAFVAVDSSDRPVGYLLLDVVDGAAHIAQVSVHPDDARLHIGQALIECAASWASALGLHSLTLTTYVDVPWNGPYYERIGFRYLTAEEESVGLRAIRKRERAAGLDAWPRASMHRSLGANNST
jgi:GNAT superfamily N-acetyltransferase